MWTIVIPLFSIETLTGSVHIWQYTPHAKETDQNMTHRAFNCTQMAPRVQNFNIYCEILICLLLCCWYCMCLSGITLVSVKQGNAASLRNNFFSPQRTPNLTPTPLITLFSVSHVPGLEDMLCKSCRWKRYGETRLTSEPCTLLDLSSVHQD